MRLKSSLLLIALAATISSGISAPAARADIARDKVRSWAILIGVEKYHRATRLRFTVNDVDQIAGALQTRGDFSEDCILKITDTQRNPRFQPLRSSIVAELPKWLEKPGPNDTVLIYFSGHGFRDGDDRLYLAPIDCDPADPADTAIAVQWVRQQIAACEAKHKLLILDSCHAGSEKGDDQERVAAKSLGEPFEDLSGVVTIASSTGEELSQIWEERQQSLFSYWLVQALKGHADRDNDNSVDIDELYKYVYRRVTRTAKSQFPRAQTPVRIVGVGTQDVPAVTRLQPLPLQTALEDMAEQLSLAMEQHELDKVGVLEFTNDTRLGELLGADYGLLGKYCAEELERQLMDYGEDQFQLVDRRKLQSALKEKNFSLDDLASVNAMTKLAKAADGMPVIALGTLRGRTGRVVNLQCKLLNTGSDGIAGSAAGVAWLNESEWAMLGRSADVSDETAIPDAPTADEPQPDPVDTLVSRLDERAGQRHPFDDPDYDFPIRIVVDHGREASKRFEVREGAVVGNEYYVPLNKGEVYQVWVENRTGQTAIMRLLVDGMNTLPEKAASGNAEKGMLVSHRVNLNGAKPWALDPLTLKREKKEWAIAGFYKKTGKTGEYRQFVVTDASRSVAARTRFAQQIGIITAAFYNAAATTRSVLGTTEGELVHNEVRERKGLEAGDLLSVVHIRYVEPATFEKLKQQAAQ